MSSLGGGDRARATRPSLGGTGWLDSPPGCARRNRFRPRWSECAQLASSGKEAGRAQPSNPPIRPGRSPAHNPSAADAERWPNATSGWRSLHHFEPRKVTRWRDARFASAWASVTDSGEPARPRETRLAACVKGTGCVRVATEAARSHREAALRAAVGRVGPLGLITRGGTLHEARRAEARGGLAWSLPGSNRRPPACKAGALPTELRPRRRTAYRRAPAPP